MSETPKDQIVPNTFQCFNAYVDRAMEHLTDGELRVLLFVNRHILGWKSARRHRHAFISVTMLEKGYDDNGGHHYGGCGLSRPSIVKALESLTTLNLLQKVGKATAKGQKWRLGAAPDWTALEARTQEKQPKRRQQTENARRTKAVNVINQLSDDEVVNPTNQERLIQLTRSGKSNLLNQSHTQSHTQSHESLPPSGDAQDEPQTVLEYVQRHGTATYTELVARFGGKSQLEIQRLVRDGKLRDDFDSFTIPAEGDEQPSPVQDYLASQVEIPDEYDKLLARVEHHYEVAGTYSKDITALLRGTSKTGDWKANNLETPITADEFDVWVGYYRSKHPDMTLPTKPTLVNGYVTGWQRLGKPAAPQSVNQPRHANKPQPAAAPELSDSDRAALAAEVRAMREGLNGNG